MDNDLQSYRASIGHFNLTRIVDFSKDIFFRSNNHLVLYILLMLIIRICFQRFVTFCHSIYLELLLQNPVSTFILLLLILLRSMRHKLDYVESICNEADIICLTETHLDQNITYDGIFIEGYCKDPFRKDRNN